MSLRNKELITVNDTILILAWGTVRDVTVSPISVKAQLFNGPLMQPELNKRLGKKFGGNCRDDCM